MALALDGHATANSNPGSTAGVAASLTTTTADDIIVAVFWGRNGNSATQINSVSGGGLTWTKRFRHHVLLNGTDECNLEVWWAHAAGTLSAASISATYSVAINRNYIAVFGVSGADTTTPFDTDASLPSIVDYTSTTNTFTHNTTFSTANANDFIFSALVDDTGNGGSGFTVDTGWTRIEDTANAAGMSVETQYKVVSATQSSVTQSVAGNLNTNSFVTFVDAIKEASTDIDVTASEAVGFSEAASVSLEQAIIAAPDMGFSQAAAVTIEMDLAASVALGFTKFASFDEAVFITAAENFGFDMAALLEADSSQSASAAVGVALAATLSMERYLTASPVLGFAQSSGQMGNKRRQPVVCVVS